MIPGQPMIPGRTTVRRVLAAAAVSLCLATLALCQSAGSAGAFARMGFGARGMGMGNALTAVDSGEISTYYNPALAPYQAQGTVMASAGILSLDRYLNFLSYTQALPPQAGISAGIINADVRNIDGRDADGQPTETYSTTENQFYLAFGNKVDPHVSIGAAIKMYYSKLFDQLTSTTVGFDIGAFIHASDEVGIGLVLQDLNSKYKWDTKALYGDNGKTTEDQFPTRRRVAVSYSPHGLPAVLDAEFENTSDQVNMLRFGGEYSFSPNFILRGGADRWELSSNPTGVKPSFGFTAKNSFNGWTAAVDYAFVIEGYAPQSMHVISISAIF